MSIWSSIWALDRDLPDVDEHTDETLWPRTYQRSHVYPSTEHPPAIIDLASIPHWCIPGHDGEQSYAAPCTAPGCDADVDGDLAGVAPWLRLAIDDPSGSLTVVLPAAAVEALRDELTDWLGRVWREETGT